MKKIVLIYGCAAGLILAILGGLTMSFLNPTHDLTIGFITGYLTMLISLSMIFVGIKKYRDKEAGGSITFWKATGLGLLIGVIATLFYVVGWEIYYQTSMSDFYDEYATIEISQLSGSGLGAAELNNKRTEILEWTSDIKGNTLLRMGLTSTEILPVVIVLSLIAATVFRKKPSISLPYRD